MKSVITCSLLAALIASVAASSSQFSSPHVADLGKDFDEKVKPVIFGGRDLAGESTLYFDAGRGWQTVLCKVLCTMVW